MTAERSLVAQDLRGAAVEYHRQRAQATKWVLGERHPFGCADTCPAVHDATITPGTKRPLKPQNQRATAMVRRSRGRMFAKGSHLAHKANRYDILEEQASVGSEDDTSDDSHGFSGEDEITYSFDAPSGPRRGSHILELALTQAVENFEGKQTDKLIKEEYEIVRPEAEPASGRSGNTKGAMLADPEDFELL